jgi:choline-glycine betaine transporter
VDREGAVNKLAWWRSQVSFTCNWLFQGTKAFFFFFLMYITYRFGHLHLAPSAEVRPFFSNLAYFCMIFAAGATVGLLVYSVAEPLEQQTGHFYANAGYRSQDEKDMFAINMAVSDWGISGWTPFAVVAVGMSLASHRYGLPMTFRSCFYPILGHYTWGWMGDVIDAVTIFVTVIGVFVSLGLGAIQLVSALIFLGLVDENSNDSQLQAIQNATIWVITAISTAAVICSLYGGTPALSGAALALSTLLMFLAFITDDTKFLLNLQVQEIGYYLQYSIFQLNFLTDAFGQLREGSGRAVDGHGGDIDWMPNWILFATGWW